jgi:hypothetical protein
MEATAIRARLMVRLLGLGLAAMFLSDVGKAIGSVVSMSPNDAASGTSVDIFYWTIPLGNLSAWLFSYALAIVAFAWGILLVWRGSRWMERRVSRALRIV